MRSILPAVIVGLVLVALVFAARWSQQRMHDYETRGTASNSADNRLSEQEQMAAAFPDTLLATTGIRFKILQAGTGPRPIAGNRVSVHYEGRLVDGSVFDSSRRRGEPFSFRLMAGEVIRGWDAAVLDMRRGEKRLVVLPYRLAYGELGSPPAIPPRATLVFEIELLDF